MQAEDEQARRTIAATREQIRRLRQYVCCPRCLVATVAWLTHTRRAGRLRECEALLAQMEVDGDAMIATAHRRNLAQFTAGI
jgi:hypothetical protein